MFDRNSFNKQSRRILAFTAAILSILAMPGCSSEKLEFSNAVIIEAPPGISVRAGYVTIKNRYNKSVNLVAIHSQAFEKAEIHRTVIDDQNGLVRMEHQKQVQLTPHNKFIFEPGGYHLMLLNPKRTIKEGDEILLTLLFSNGDKHDVNFKIRSIQFKL